MQIAETAYMTLKAEIKRDDQYWPHLEFWVVARGDNLISKVERLSPLS